MVSCFQETTFRQYAQLLMTLCLAQPWTGLFKIRNRAATLAYFGKGIEVARDFATLVREMFAEKGEKIAHIADLALS